MDGLPSVGVFYFKPVFFQVEQWKRKEDVDEGGGSDYAVGVLIPRYRRALVNVRELLLQHVVCFAAGEKEHFMTMLFQPFP